MTSSLGGDRIVEIEPRVSSLVQWEEIEAHVIAPELGKVLKGLDGRLERRARRTLPRFSWARYLRDLEGLFLAMRSRAADRSAARLRVLRTGLAAHLEPGFERGAAVASGAGHAARLTRCQRGAARRPARRIRARCAGRARVAEAQGPGGRIRSAARELTRTRP